MDFNWFFRGNHNSYENSDSFLRKNEYHSEDPKEENIRSFDYPMVDPFESILDTSHDMFRCMDDMFNQMFSSSFTTFGSVKFEDYAQKETDPRSLMLKDPDFKKCEQYPSEESFEPTRSNTFVDTDIDDEVAKNGLILESRTSRNMMPKAFSYKKFSSIRTVHLPDGTLEEHRTDTDSQGNVTTTIRRSIGNQQHEITTRSDREGVNETQENMINLDENELSVFEKRWQNLKHGENRFSDSKSLVPKLNPSVGDPSYSSILKKFFGF